MNANPRKLIASLALCLCFLLSFQVVHADVISVEPDLFFGGTDISNAFPGVYLSAVGGSAPSPVFAVEMFQPCCPYAITPSTGMNIFGHSGVNNIVWKPSHLSDPRYFRADFESPTTWVSIDMIQASADIRLGSLLAYDANGSMLDSVVISGLGRDEVSTAYVTSSVPAISYIIVDPDADIALDNLRYGVSTVPIPAAAYLFGSGLLGIIGISRRTSS